MTSPLPQNEGPDDTVGVSQGKPFDALDEGIRLALRVEEAGQASAFVRWLTEHPGRAAEVAQFLAAQRDVGTAMRGTGSVVGDPTHLGRFELHGELGRGGLGIVYRAYDPHLKREVALKLIRGGFLEPEQRNRFRFEAESVASLDPKQAIVPVYEFGEEDGIPYLVMPIMEGGSLTQRLRDLGPDRCLPACEAATLIRDVARGVQHAHERGILHRDLKSANILLDRAGRPHVADFGLARSLTAIASLSGELVGTPAYMSPEQARGEKQLTTATDVYALGVILYELLTGERPFVGPNVLTVLQRAQDENARSIRESRSDVPLDLESICMKCLAKQPQDRYVSAQALIVDLNRFLDGEPIGEQRPSLFTWMGHALKRRQEMPSWGTWPTAFVGVANTTICLGCMQVGALVESLHWLSLVGLIAYLVGWGLIVWGFLVLRLPHMSGNERTVLATQIGLYLSALAIVPAELLAHDGEALFVLQPLAVLVALSRFTWGTTWGRMYVVSLLLLGLAALMPLVPLRLWPGFYAALLVGLQCWKGLKLRRFDREGRARAVEERAESETPTGGNGSERRGEASR